MDFPLYDDESMGLWQLILPIVVRGGIGAIIKKPQLGDLPLIIITLILTVAFGVGAGVML